MKKIVMAALVACATCAFAEDVAPATGSATATRQVRAAQRPQLTPEQRRERREKFMAQMKARQEAVQTKIVAALKEAGLDDAKAKETAEKIQKIYSEGRRPPRPAAHAPKTPAS